MQRIAGIIFGVIARVEQELIDVGKTGFGRDAGIRCTHAERVDTTILGLSAHAEDQHADHNKDPGPGSGNVHHLVARFFQKRSRLSSPPNNVVKIVESASSMSPARSPLRRHPEEHVELAVSGFDKGMRLGHIDRLPCQHVNSPRIFGGHGVMRQMHMENERPDIGEPTARIQVAGD